MRFFTLSVDNDRSVFNTFIKTFLVFSSENEGHFYYFTNKKQIKIKRFLKFEENRATLSYIFGKSHSLSHLARLTFDLKIIGSDVLIFTFLCFSTRWTA